MPPLPAALPQPARGSAACRALAVRGTGLAWPALPPLSFALPGAEAGSGRSGAGRSPPAARRGGRRCPEARPGGCRRAPSAAPARPCCGGGRLGTARHGSTRGGGEAAAASPSPLPSAVTRVRAARRGLLLAGVPAPLGGELGPPAAPSGLLRPRSERQRPCGGGLASGRRGSTRPPPRLRARPGSGGCPREVPPGGAWRWVPPNPRPAAVSPCCRPRSAFT